MLFEAFAMALIEEETPVNSVAKTVRKYHNAHIVYDKFHMVQEANKRLDEVRKAEAKEKKLLKGHRFTFLHLRKNLPEKKLQELDTLLLTYPLLGKANSLKEGLVDILGQRIFPVGNTIC